MKMKIITISLLLIFGELYAQSWIRINQVGYLEKSHKNAVLISKENMTVPKGFIVRDALTDDVVFKSDKVTGFDNYGPFKKAYRLNFSEFTKSGAYYVEASGVKSPSFRVSNDVYDGTADFLLRYMRQQRCGYNHFLGDSCHTHDGFIIYHPTLDSTFIDVTGGWHDASDYLQYVTTSANTVYQMLFAYQQNPSSFGDEYDAGGKPGANGIPDILDEAKWGLDWLDRMNPENEMMFNQIADDRDHIGFKLPALDKIDYGKGPRLGRPVYFCTGRPQGVFNNKNRADGIASTAGKYASSFSLGAKLLKKYYPEFAEKIRKKSLDAYDFGKKNPGVCQTAPCKSPYFYEEDNYVDDMELAAVELYSFTSNNDYLKDAVEFGRKEPVTPWMGADTASHYQWYPFLNLGHYYLAAAKDKKVSSEFSKNFREGIEKVYQRGKTNPFQIGIPFIWCSNNLVAAMVTQSKLYFEMTKDDKYQEMEAALCDWLFGCNPWGTSMIMGFPKTGDYPVDPHSAMTAVYKMNVEGGLVDGPVYSTIYNNLKGIALHADDEYAELQPGRMVYHDDYGDYSTNEPTMDGTASLTYFLGALQADGAKAKKIRSAKNEKELGAVIRTDRTKKEIHLAFTGHEFADGGTVIRKVLNKHKIKGMFFFTGDFYRNPQNSGLIYSLKKEGHYLGAHSDKHLLYADWTKRDSLLVTREQFENDLKANYAEMAKFGITKDEALKFMPPYEWYNEEVNGWTNALGLTLINYTPGTSSNADYTTPDMKNYLDSEKIYNKILDYEKSNRYGLNGFVLLSHIGTHPDRTDKFYNKLDQLINVLKSRGYKFNIMD